MEFKECSICAAKPGSPTLCPSCLNNRRIIVELQRKIKELEDVLDTSIFRIKKENNKLKVMTKEGFIKIEPLASNMILIEQVDDF